MNCSGCLSAISQEEYVQCSSEFCVKVLHITCANISQLTPEQRETWFCPDCRASAKRGGDNTPARACQNITQRKKTNPATESSTVAVSDCTQDTPELKLIVSELRNLRQEMANMKSEFNKRFDDLTSRLVDYDMRLRALELKEKENDKLKEQVAQLQDKLNIQSHHNLRSDLEILGVSEIPGENPYHLVLTTACKIGINLEEHDLDYVSRAGKLDKDKSQDSSKLPRPLVSSSGKQKLGARNERLTNEARQLFRVTRTWIRDNGYRYCWVRNGTIYIRKRDGREGSPTIQVRSTECLQKLTSNKDML
ncbi:hypothetical protein ABMA28_010997 [Loxostege sticticalis]|uniref:PHD-type domain-containing protein n=1 Tax=Loxostege sticticalis TaxID=481309 RepID=A0ABD0S822_LOXSC